MASLIGLHMRSNGIKQIPSRAVLSLNGAGLGGDETHADTITVLRDTRVFPDGEAPPDWRTYDGSNWAAFGAYWYSERTVDGGNLKSAWYQNPADYYQITNEQGGGEGPDVEGNYIQLVKVERAIMQAANADGRKCCVLNLAGGSPGDFELWKAICAPFIVEAWENGGNVYGRHCYSDKFVNDDGSIVPGQPQRVIDELEYLRSIGYGGGMVLTECGLYGGYGVADYDYFEQQVTRWEQALRPYADIFIGLAWWETGYSEDFKADYTNHLKQLLPYIEAGDLPRWTPLEPPDGGEPVTTIKTAVFGTAQGLSDKKVTALEFQYAHTEDKKNLIWSARVPLDLATLIPDLAEIDLREVRLRVPVEMDCPDEPTDPNPPPVELTLPQGSKGVDLSNYQAGFFDLVDPDDFDFYIFRCSDGMNTSATSQNHDANGVDLSLWKFADVGHASGKPWGIYHFLRPGNVEAQIDKVKLIYQMLVDRGTPPRTAVFDDGSLFTATWCDFEDWNVSNFQVKQFCEGVDVVAWTGIYSGQSIWNSKASGIVPWWTGRTCWFADYGANNGTVPNRDPLLLNEFYAGHIWQFSSQYGNEAGWKSDSLDINVVGPYYPESKPDPPTPPQGQTYDTSFMRAVPNAWRVIRRFDGSGEDIWDLPLGGDRFVRVKNTTQGEWYNGNMRERDTSPAPQPDGTERLYLLNGGDGGQIAPDVAEVGVTYSYTNQVQFKAKQGCADLSLNSGTAVSTFLLREVIDNYTFPTTGFTVDRLFWTVQTGENQLYAIKDGVNIGWVGGGAQQDNNVWGGEIQELYFDRSIPQQEPPRFCG